MLANKDKKEEEAEMLQRFLTVTEMTVAHKYPQSAKLYLKHCEKGFKFIDSHCRICKHEFNEEEAIRIVHLKDIVKYVQQALKDSTLKGKNVLL